MSVRNKPELFAVMWAMLLCVSILWSGAVVSQTAIRSDFDHDSTGFRLDGAHIMTSCGDCHRRGTFASTVRECDGCHTRGGIVPATAKPARHILSTQNCSSCHATRSFIPLDRMDHNEVYGECASCHNNITAPGKPVDHPPAGNQCETCHLTVAF